MIQKFVNVYFPPNQGGLFVLCNVDRVLNDLSTLIRLSVIHKLTPELTGPCFNTYTSYRSFTLSLDSVEREHFISWIEAVIADVLFILNGYLNDKVNIIHDHCQPKWSVQEKTLTITYMYQVALGT